MHGSKYFRGPESANMLKSEKGIISTNVYKNSPKVNHIVCTMIPDCLQNFINLASGDLEIFCLQDFPVLKYLSLKMGHNLIKNYKSSPRFNQVIYTLVLNCLQTFMNLSQEVP